MVNPSAEQARDGVQLVGTAGDILRNISHQVVSVGNLVHEIASSPSEQALGLKDLRCDKSHRSGDPAECRYVEEATAATIGLNSEAVALKQFVSKFKMKHADIPATQRAWEEPTAVVHQLRMPASGGSSR